MCITTLALSVVFVISMLAIRYVNFNLFVKIYVVTYNLKGKIHFARVSNHHTCIPMHSNSSNPLFKPFCSYYNAKRWIKFIHITYTITQQVKLLMHQMFVSKLLKKVKAKNCFLFKWKFPYSSSQVQQRLEI